MMKGQLVLFLTCFVLPSPFIALPVDAFATSCGLLVIAPELITEHSPPFTEIRVGQQFVITTAFSNNCSDYQPYVGIIEVRNSDDVTEYLAWRTGTLQYGDSVEMGVSWAPEHADTYELRTLAISDLPKPDILSPLAISNVTIVE